MELAFLGGTGTVTGSKYLLRAGGASLLVDCVRVLTRLLREAAEYVDLRFTNHIKRAKRRAMAIRRNSVCRCTAIS